jgi:hypothetical protein
MIKVVLQGHTVEIRAWPYVQVDVWRVNNSSKAFNVAKQVTAGQVINPCNDFNPVSSSEMMTLGSENIGVGRSQPFAIYTGESGDEEVVQGNCACK